MQALCSATRCHANVLGCMFLTIDLAKINIAPQPFVSKTSISTNEILHVNICKSTKAWSESHAIMPTLVLLTRLVAPIFEDNCGLLQWHTWLSKAILAQLLLHEDMPPPPHTNKKDEKKHYIQAKCCIFPPFRKKKLQNLKNNIIQTPNLSSSSLQNSWVGFVRFHDPQKDAVLGGHLHGVWINNACIAFKVLHIGTILGESDGVVW